MKKFEFVLKINGNIVCQRYFSVKDPNENVIKSLDLYYTSKRCVDLIHNNLKSKSEDYLWNNYNPYDTESDPVRVTEDKDDYFTFEIRVDDRTIMSEYFSGKPYPPRVRYSVNIKEIIPFIIQEIQETFSQEIVTTNYGLVTL
jgi:hypothetical protein